MYELNEETLAQARARQERAENSAARFEELRARDQARREFEKAERNAVRRASLQSEGRMAWQVLKVARIDKEKAEQELQEVTKSLTNAQRKYDELVGQGYVDDISPVLEKQEREKQACEGAERARREKAQADAIANSGREMSFEEREALNAKIREANANPTGRLCPQCRTHVQLVNGQLPESHEYRVRNEFGELEKRICRPYGAEPVPHRDSPEFVKSSPE